MGSSTTASLASRSAASTAEIQQIIQRLQNSANGVLKVSEAQRQEAIALCLQSDQDAALGCMQAFSTTDFRGDLMLVDVPTLVLHGDADATVPFEGSGQRTHAAIAGSELVLLEDAPHGCNTSHSGEFNRALLAFLGRTG